MRISDVVRKALILMVIVLTASVVLAQGTRGDYQRAERFLPDNIGKLVFNLDVRAHWLDDSTQFWYRNDTRTGKEFVLVDAEQNTRKSAFDHVKLAEELSKVAGEEYSPNKLPFDSFKFIEERKAIQFDIKEDRWKCLLTTYKCEKIKKAEKLPGESPDGRWIAFVKDYNLYVRLVKTGEEIQLSHDGKELYDYATPLPSPRIMIQQGTMRVKQRPGVTWSPDSKKLATYRIDQRKAKHLHLLQSVPPKGVRPVLYSYAYPLPGETDLPMAELLIFDVENKKQIKVEHGPLPLLYYGYPDIYWFKDSQRVYFEEVERGYKALKLRETDANTGKTRTILEEKSETCVDPGLVYYYNLVDDGKEVILPSERDGWNHLYLYDGKTSELKNQITKGEWIVRYILYVDEKARQVYFIGGGREKGRNPYFQHLYRVNFDGTNLVLLTPEDADHGIRFSPNGKFFIDTYSKVDTIPVTVLRRSSDGKVIRELEKADIEKLLATGWKFPEEFCTKARDGKTDIYGVIFRPSSFDPAKKYPVIDRIYTGPHSFFAPKSFNRGYHDVAQSIAELGFIVVAIDGMGTGKRSKAFHNVSYKNLKDGGLEDHIAGFRQLAERYPYMDLDRVGIFGFSAGGYDTVNAMLSHPDFYKVGVAASGNHDHRMDKAWWNELWMDFPVKNHYKEQSNITHAHKLKGKLLLVHGDLDHNVHPYCTIQLVDALIKANKDFDFLIIPNQNHFLDESPYYVRKRWDYFVKHLLGVEPPKGYKIGELEIK